LFKNTLWMLLGLGTRAAVQAVYFVIIARLLGPTGYGAFAGVVALVALVAPFSGLGMSGVLLRDVARDHRTFPRSWGDVLMTLSLSGGLLTALVVALARMILPNAVATLLVVAVSVSDLLLAKIVEAGSQAFQAVQQLRETARLPVLMSGFRLAGALVLLVSDTSSATTWGALYCFSTGLSALVAVRRVHRLLGRPLFNLEGLAGKTKDSLAFSVGLAAQNAYNDLDKTMLASLSTLAAAGVYSAAYRAVDLAFTPVAAVLHASYARFFQHGVSSLKAAFKFAQPLLLTMLAYSVLASGALFFGAAVAPVILGSRYVAAAEALRWLSLLPFIKTLHYFVANALTGSGYQWMRSIIQTVVAGANVFLNLWLIPAYSWRGAALASLASDGLLALSLWVVLGILWPRRDTP